MQISASNRNKTIDIVKGICIILVVIGHSCDESVKFIYMFHMAVFFIASGCCYNDKHSENYKAVLANIYKKIRTLYLPYIMCVGAFTLLHNLFLKIGFYTSNEAFTGNALSIDYAKIDKYNLTTMLEKLIKTLFFLGGEQLTAATWFIRVLFFVSVGWLIIDLVIKKIIPLHIHLMRWVIAILLFAIGYYLNYKNIQFKANIPVIFTAYILYVLGVYIKKIVDKYSDIFRKIYVLCAVFILSLAMLLLLCPYENIFLDANIYNNPITFILISISGWLFIWSAASLIKIAFLSELLSYIGRNTMPILVLHLLSFKIVNFIIVQYYDIPGFWMAGFPVLRTDGVWWIGYTLIGVAVPLMINYLYKIAYNKIITSRKR